MPPRIFALLLLSVVVAAGVTVAVASLLPLGPSTVSAASLVALLLAGGLFWLRRSQR